MHPDVFIGPNHQCFLPSRIRKDFVWMMKTVVTFVLTFSSYLPTNAFCLEGSVRWAMKKHPEANSKFSKYQQRVPGSHSPEQLRPLKTSQTIFRSSHKPKHSRWMKDQWTANETFKTNTDARSKMMRHIGCNSTIKWGKLHSLASCKALHIPPVNTISHDGSNKSLRKCNYGRYD